MKPNIDSTNYILCNSYTKLCDSVWTAEHGAPDPGIIHVSCDDVKTFFELYGNNGKDYILVSSSSDFGLYEQAKAPVWADFHKGAQLIPPHMLQDENGYFGINIGPRCNANNCSVGDRYSIKCHSWTNATFNEIPSNIKYWFLTNCMVDDPRCEPIPFGIFSDPDSVAKIAAHEPGEKTKILYCNFQNYTRERYDIKRWFSNEDWATVVWDANVPFEQFLADMSSHWLVAAPPGNGVDSYRVLESIYLGCIPIIESNFNAQAYDGLPVVGASDIRKLTVDFALNTIETFNSNNNLNYDKATLSYWRNRFENARMEFL